MESNPSFGSNQQAGEQVPEYDELAQIKKEGAEVLKKGWSYLSWGASKVKQKADQTGVSAKVSNAASVIKQKADEHGVTEKARIAAEKAKIAARNAADYTKESAKSVKQTAEEGKLQEKTSEKAQ